MSAGRSALLFSFAEGVPLGCPLVSSDLGEMLRGRMKYESCCLFKYFRPCAVLFTSSSLSSEPRHSRTRAWMSATVPSGGRVLDFSKSSNGSEPVRGHVSKQGLT